MKVLKLLMVFAVANLGIWGTALAATTTNKMSYGTNNQAISIGLVLPPIGPNGNLGRSGTAIDNTTNLFLDALVTCKYQMGSANNVSTGTIVVYAYGTVDGGTNYTDGLAGSSATITLTSPPNTFKVGVINANTNSTTYVGGPWSVAQAFGGVLPDHWGITVFNYNGSSTTASSSGCWYQGVWIQNL